VLGVFCAWPILADIIARSPTGDMTFLILLTRDEARRIAIAAAPRPVETRQASRAIAT
jgi:hypothetical protein